MQITALDHEWQKRIEEARASGLTAHAWCMENKIPISTVYTGSTEHSARSNKAPLPVK